MARASLGVKEVEMPLGRFADLTLAQALIEARRAGSKNPRHAQQWGNILEAYA